MDARTLVDYEDDQTSHHMIPAGSVVHVDIHDYLSHLYITHTEQGQLGLYRYFEVVPLATA
jgi:hypothetical protein